MVKRSLTTRDCSEQSPILPLAFTRQRHIAGARSRHKPRLGVHCADG